MRPADCFGVIVRTAGLVLAIWFGLYPLANWVFYLPQSLYDQPNAVVPISTEWIRNLLFVLASALWVFFGWFIIRKSDWIVRLAYPAAGAIPTCSKCGYDLRASKDRCPECRTPIPQ